MLAIWLLALTAGIVNACVVEPVSEPAAVSGLRHGSGPGVTHTHSKSSGATGHDAPLPGDRKAPCAGHFGEESNSLPTLKQASAAWAGLWLAPPPRPLPVNAPRALGEFTPRPDASLRRERIPIPIAFLRLAL